MRERKRSVLLISFQFPPFAGSSAVQRTLNFCRHLPANGWQPIVLTASPMAYEATSQAEGNEVPAGVIVKRAQCLDAARHLSIGGRYLRPLALPDRWASWRIFAVSSAMALIREYRPSAILSTFPIATAHQIGSIVARKSGLPWIAEFRDPMWQGDYPEDPLVNRNWLALERKVFGLASRAVVTTPGAANLYAQRYPDFGADRIVEIPNGYDEDVFRRATAGSSREGSPAAGPVRILHSGVIYPSERDPRHFFAAIGALKKAAKLGAADLNVTLRATGYDSEIQRMIDEQGISDIVMLERPTGYLAAIREMLEVDGLLVLQADNCNAQIPAKVYEYIRARRPILALTSPEGDTATVLRRAGVGVFARLDSQHQIEKALMEFVEARRQGQSSAADDHVIESYSRAYQAKVLAGLLDDLVR